MNLIAIIFLLIFAFIAGVVVGIEDSSDNTITWQHGYNKGYKDAEERFKNKEKSEETEE